ncbi:MAG: hypothetical protein K2F56_05345 [Anaeroplasmataceae bacterium]|nr:hypothetical protein [Anaeroplasmataceae bacterium]
MKKIWILLIVSFLFVLAGCKTNQEDTDKILSIELKNIENIDVYQGDVYSPRNVIVYAVYEKKKVDVTIDANFSEISTESLGYQTVTVTYLEFRADYSVRVIERPYEISLSLRIKALPEKIEYYSGEELSISGIHVVIVENEEELGRVDLFSLKVSIKYFGTIVSGFSEIGPYEIIVSTEYKSKTLTTSFFVEVVTNPSTQPREQLRVTTDNVKKEFLLHEEFNTDGLVIYIQDETENITEIKQNLCKIELSLNGVIKEALDEEGVYSVHVSFGDMDAYYGITVLYREPVKKIVVDYSAARLQFNVGEAYSSTGLDILYYEDDVLKRHILPANCRIRFELRGVEVYNFDYASTYTIIIEYEGLKDSYRISVV